MNARYTVGIDLGTSHTVVAFADHAALVTAGEEAIRLLAIPRAVGPGGMAFSDTLRRAEGQVVRLVGHMVKCATPVPGRFLLSPCPLQIVGEAGSQGNDLPPGAVTVCQDPSQQDWIVPHIDGLVAVNGTLSVMSIDEPRGRMPRLRLQLGPDAERGLTAAEIAGFLHRRRHLNA